MQREGLPDYVERHGVILPEEFVASVAARAWKVPPLDQIGTLVPGALIYRALRSGDMALVDKIEKSIREGGCKVDYSIWLEWARRLPEVPAVQSSPDSRVLDRFSLVFQCPYTDEPHEKLDGFDELWDKVGE